MPKKKKFIDKKNAVTFHLVHRSQRDPLQANEDVGQRVLLEAISDPEKRKQQQREYGINFEDDYDYLQHLRDVNEINEVGFGEEPVERFRVDAKPKGKSSEPKLNLPSTVFGSQVEQEVGMLNKAAPVSGPKLDWDPDIVAALDDDFDYDDPDNILDDDFMAIANDADGGSGLMEGSQSTREDFTVRSREGHLEEEEDDEWSDEDMEDEDDDIASDEAEEGASDVGSLDDGFSFTEEETKSRFTQYSVTSSVIRRSQGLTLLDDRFEKFFEQYDDDELGALDHEDIDGRVDPNSKILDSMVEEFNAQRNRPKLKDVIEKVKDLDVDSDSGSEDVGEELVTQTEEAKEKWDCESILSTYSNLYHHPTLIKEPRKAKIRVDERTGLPVVKSDGPGMSLKEIEKEMNSSRNKEDRACTYRPSDESTDERKARKSAVKQERRERRQEKKATKIAFRKEGIKHNKERINAARNEGVKMS